MQVIRLLANHVSYLAWRKVLKDLILFFKEVQKSYETRAKLFMSASNVVNNQTLPQAFLQSGGLADATEILRDFHRQGYTEANKAIEVEVEVISQLTGLRSDLQKKTKEIKSLSGDFKNTVDKEIDGTRKSVRNLHEALGLVDTDPSATSGKGDPFIMRLNVEKQVEKQIEEENYLHRVCAHFARALVTTLTITALGILESGELWSRTGGDCGERDPKGIQRLRQYPSARGQRGPRHSRQATGRSDLHATGPRVEFIRCRYRRARRSPNPPSECGEHHLPW